ncbi:hypothetical protein [Roseateles koreensis]|uniref:hypothetical protein n=1 Tax=Roseateles koreensis TaxID=2987526 RepID=UPI0023582A6B|nr:hypothetical protein [Roseateles koreensis]
MATSVRIVPFAEVHPGLSDSSSRCRTALYKAEAFWGLPEPIFDALKSVVSYFAAAKTSYSGFRSLARIVGALKMRFTQASVAWAAKLTSAQIKDGIGDTRSRGWRWRGYPDGEAE